MKLAATIAFLFALPSLVAAQTPPCQAFNDQNSSSSTAVTAAGFAGPTSRGFRFTASCTQPLRGARIFTSSPVQAWSMSLELWSENPATQLPLARLAGGTCTLPVGQPTGWYGANFDAAVPVVANTDYWLVWVEPGFLQVPYETNGVTLLNGARISGGSWIADTARALKLRLFSTLLDDFGVRAQPDACASSAGKLGTIFTNELPVVGSTIFHLEGSGFTPGAPAVLFLGTIPGFGAVPLPGTNGCFLHNELLIALSSSVFTGALRSATPSGNLDFAFPIPNLPLLRGQIASAFFVAIDAGSSQPLPVVSSNGIELTVL